MCFEGSLLNDLVAVKENINMKIQWYLKKRKNNLD